MATKPVAENIVIHGPMWQYECERCGEMDDAVYDTEAQAKRASGSHDCIVAFRHPWSMRKKSKGVYEGTIGHERTAGGMMRFEVREIEIVREGDAIH